MAYLHSPLPTLDELHEHATASFQDAVSQYIRWLAWSMEPQQLVDDAAEAVLVARTRLRQLEDEIKETAR